MGGDISSQTFRLGREVHALRAFAQKPQSRVLRKLRQTTVHFGPPKISTELTNKLVALLVESPPAL